METIKYKNEIEYTFESSNLEGESIFELNHLDSPVRFYTLDEFKPQITDGYKNTNPIVGDISQVVKYINDQREGLQHLNHRTAINTIERRESAEDITDFVKETIGSFDDKTFINLDIDRNLDIHNLTPAEAAKISVNLVRELSNYDHLSVKLEDGFEKFISSINGFKPSQKIRDTFYKYSARGDRSSVLELLTSLRDNPNTPSGVCRNYANATKIIFDALKETQDPERTKLSNIHCITQSDNIHGGPHMWNVFIANTDDGVAFCPADPTGSRELDNPALSRVYTEKIIDLFSSITRANLDKSREIIEWEELKSEKREQLKSSNNMPEEWKNEDEEELPPTEFEMEKAINNRDSSLKTLEEIYQFYRDSASEYAKFSSNSVDISNPNDPSLQIVRHFLEEASKVAESLKDYDIAIKDIEMVKSFLERISTLETPSVESPTSRTEKLSKVGRGVMSLFKSLRR